MLPLIRKQKIFKSLPYPFTWTLAPNGGVDVLDLVYAYQPRPQIVKPKARLNEIRASIHILGS